MRFWLVFILIFGIGGAMLSHLPSRRPASEALYVNATGTGEEASARSTKLDSLSSSEGSLDIPRSEDGHFYANVDVNGSKIRMLIDTGASIVALSREDARSAGIATSIGMPNVVGEGADGSIHGEVVTVDRMSLGNARVEGAQALVLSNGGQSLLGQSFLAKFASVEIHGDTMTLR